MWHELILETRTYRSLCDRIHPGRFLDHAGLTFADYQASVDSDEIKFTHFSVLATYVASFGDFTSESLRCWGVAREIAEKMGWSVADLNLLWRELASNGNSLKVLHVENA